MDRTAWLWGSLREVVEVGDSEMTPRFLLF